MRFLGIIPARYASSRFPGKPLVDIKGKPMIQHVYENAKKVIEEVYVATDDQRIYEAVEKFGGKVVLTSENHQSGTDRCAEASEKISTELNKEFDVVINIQGDEPFIKIEQIELLKNCFIQDTTTQIGTLIKKITLNKDIFDINKPKVIVSKNNQAIYFSRSPIPFLRDKDKECWNSYHTFYKHIGMYAYNTSILKEITKLEQSKLEIAESLEQLRWIENGYKIKIAETNYETIGIDTPEDLKKALDYI